MTMSDKDRFHLQALMERDPDAALVFLAEKTASFKAIAPITQNVPAARQPPIDFKKIHKPGIPRSHTLWDFGKEDLDDGQFGSLAIPPVLPVDYDILEAGVLGEAKDLVLARDVLRPIESVFEHIRADGSYVFGPSSHVVPGDLRLALSEATDRQVGQVILSRDSEIVPRQPWMSDKEHFMSAISALNGACDSYVGKLHDSISLVRDPRQSAATSLPVSMGQMETLVRKSFGAFLLGPLSHSEICNALSRTLTMALSCVIDSDAANAGRFIGLLEILPYALPFGKRKSDPHSWIVRIGD